MRDKLFTLRPFHPDDIDSLYPIITHPEVYKTLLRLPTMEKSEMQEWANKQVNGRYRLVVTHQEEAIAFGSLDQNLRARLIHSGRIGLYVSPDFWGQGVGSLLLTGLLDIADNWLDLRRIQLEVFTDNQAAVRLYEKFGFEIEGMARKIAFGEGRWYDEFVMARLRRADYGAPSAGWQPVGKPNKPKGPIIIRPFDPTDVSAMHTMMIHPGVSRTTLQLPAYERSQYENRMMYRKNVHRFVAEANGHLIGSISIHTSENPRMAHSGGLGMGVHPDYWGMGVGSKLMAAIIDLADNWLNLKRVDLDVNTDNPAGIRLYEKFGFEIEGTRRFHAFGDGRWADSYFMGRIKA